MHHSGSALTSTTFEPFKYAAGLFMQLTLNTSNKRQRKSMLLIEAGPDLTRSNKNLEYCVSSLALKVLCYLIFVISLYVSGRQEVSSSTLTPTRLSRPPTCHIYVFAEIKEP